MTADRALTVRTRLALLYGALFLFGGALLLGVTLTLVRQALIDLPVDPAVLARVSGTGGRSPTEPNRSDAAVEPSWTPPPRDSDVVVTGGQPPGDKELYELATDLQADLRRSTLSTLLTRGALALTVIALTGVWLGWLVAGRTLRPIRQITATARRVADDSLHERIALSGPRDELRELADTFDDMLCRLDAAFDSQRRFVASASHELKTPLAINRTLLEVAMDRPDATPQLRELGGTLLKVNARQERLIEGLLTLARSEQPVTDPAPVNLADLCDIVADAARPEAARAGIRITTELVAVWTRGDAILLERLVQNLVQNATQYNTSGGSVRLSCVQAGDRVRLTVSNTGPLIAEHEITGLFEPFRRLTDRVGSWQGSGLGLSIVRSVARAHGGEVTATSGARGGLVVTVVLPAARSAGS